MAVNVWFNHLPVINTTECENYPEIGQLMKFKEGIKIGPSIEMARSVSPIPISEQPIFLFFSILYN